MAVRDMKKAEMVKEKIVIENPEADIVLLEIDLSSLSSVARFCSQFLSQDLPLNIIMYVRFTPTPHEPCTYNSSRATEVGLYHHFVFSSTFICTMRL